MVRLEKMKLYKVLIMEDDLDELFGKPKKKGPKSSAEQRRDCEQQAGHSWVDARHLTYVAPGVTGRCMADDNIAAQKQKARLEQERQRKLEQHKKDMERIKKAMAAAA